jgi:hypothetical protein
MIGDYSGLLGNITEAGDIAEELGCDWDQAREIQRQRADEREQEYRDELGRAIEKAREIQRQRAIAAAESNVIQFRPRQK